MKNFLWILLGVQMVVGCGGAQSTAETTSATPETADSAESSAAPADDAAATVTATPKDADDTAATVTATPKGADDTTATEAATPAAATADPAALPPEQNASDKEAVKEASEARITDKNIVISGKILFQTGNAKLLKVSFPVLDEVVFALEKHPEIIKLQVVGHTDSDGNAKANKALSKRRAASVVKYLVKNGIEKDRLLYVGVGADKPIASNDTEEGKDKNRRVEFEIVERAKVVAVTHTSGTAMSSVKSREATDDETEELIKKEGIDKKFQ